jgi:hypothetical protein
MAEITPLTANPAADSLSAKISFTDWLASKGLQTREDEDRGLMIRNPDPEARQQWIPRDSVQFAELERDWHTSAEAHDDEVWGTEQAYWAGRNNIGANESAQDVDASGNAAFVAENGRQYIRTATKDNSRFYPFMRSPDDLVYDARWGWGVDPAVAKAYNASHDNSAQMFMTALSMVGAPYMAALGAGGAGGGMFGNFMPDNPIISGAIKGGVQGGISSLISGGNPIQGVLGGALTGGAGGGADMLSSAGEFNPILSGAIKGGAQGLLSSAMGGGNPLEGLLRGGAMGGGGAALNQGMNSIMSPGSEGPVMVAAGPSETMSDAGDPLAGVSFSEGSYMNQPGFLQPASQGSRLDQILGIDSTAPSELYTPAPQEFLGPTFEEKIGVVDPFAAFTSPVPNDLPSGVTRPAQPPADEETIDVEKDLDLADEDTAAAKPTNYAGVVKSIYSAYQALTGTELPPVKEYTPPARSEGQDEAEYQEELTASLSEYLDVDLSPSGIKPGTPEYMSYLLDQIDSIIESIVGMDASVLLEGESTEDLQGAIRGKTDAEMQQLLRALHSRGALDSMSAASEAVDPFTGLMQELGLAEGDMTNPAIAAYQRGIAGFGEGLLDSVSGADARAQIDEMLKRNPDLFNLQARRDARRMQELLYQMQDDDERKRRGLGLEAAPGLGNDFWRDLLESRDTQLLDRMLRGVGSRERQGRAVEQLLGLGM